jgi:hypothetical protein
MQTTGKIAGNDNAATDVNAKMQTRDNDANNDATMQTTDNDADNNAATMT